MSYYERKDKLYNEVETAFKMASKEFVEIDIDQLIFQMERKYGMRLVAKKYIDKLIENGLISISMKNGKKYGVWDFSVSEKPNSIKTDS